MPTDQMSKFQITILTYGLYALVFILTTMTAWQHYQITSMPTTYVMKSDYQCDVDRIERKLDQLIRDISTKSIILGDTSDHRRTEIN